MQSGLHPSIHAFQASQWDALNPSAYPGLLHGFLSALEDSKSVGEGTGWTPLYAAVKDGDALVGATPFPRGWLPHDWWASLRVTL